MFVETECINGVDRQGGKLDIAVVRLTVQNFHCGFDCLVATVGVEDGGVHFAVEYGKDSAFFGWHGVDTYNKYLVVNAFFADGTACTDSHIVVVSVYKVEIGVGF